MSPRALVVEDNPLNCALFLEVLRHDGFAPFCDYTGASAQHLAESLNPAVALVDLQLPEVAGLDVIRGLRASRATREIPIVAVSAFARTEDGLGALAAGADLFFCKPVDPRRLSKAILRLTGPVNEAVNVA
ncbi:MAG: response regulator [Pseudomonadota bacterium]